MQSRQDVRLDFERCGGLIALAYLFRGRDLHMENLIATSGGPVLIDLELLFEPELAGGHDSELPIPATRRAGRPNRACPAGSSALSR